MEYRIAEARSRRQGNSRTRIIEAPITHRCGHETMYRSSEHGWSIVAALSADVDCDSCNKTLRQWCETEGKTLADEFVVRQAEFETAVALRDDRLNELGIDNVFDRRVATEQNAVFAAGARLDESKRARSLMIPD